MKKAILFSSLFLLILMYACGPAAEDRQRMHARAKVFQDSIATFIRQSMNEAEMPANGMVVMDTAAQRINSQAARTATTK